MTRLDPVETYRRARRAFLAVIEGSDPEVEVTACPGWRVRDVLAHVSGIASDFLSGRLPAGDVNRWTAEQVDQRRGMTVDDLRVEWDLNAPGFEYALAHALAGGAPRFAADVVSHGFDVATVVGRPGERQAPHVDEALTTFAVMLGERLDREGRGGVSIQAGSIRLAAGSAGPVAALSGPPFEILRALSGRRTEAELAAMRWTGERDTVLDLLSPFPLPTEPLGE